VGKKIGDFSDGVEATNSQCLYLSYRQVIGELQRTYRQHFTGLSYRYSNFTTPCKVRF
jgi:hypothetical protein